MRIYAWALAQTIAFGRCGIRTAWVGLALELVAGILVATLALTIATLLLIWILS